MNRGTLAQSICLGWPCAPGQSLERDQQNELAMVPCLVAAPKLRAPKNEFCKPFQADLVSPVSLPKIFLFTKIGNYGLTRAIPCLSGGAYRDRHDTWRGTAVDALSRSDEALSVADGEVVWS